MYKTGRCQEDLKSLIYEIICGLNLKVIYSGIIKKIWSAILCFQYYRRYTCLLQNSVIKQICEKSTNNVKISIFGAMFDDGGGNDWDVVG